MRTIAVQLIRSLLGLFYFVLSALFFYIDLIIVQHVIWPSWAKGSFQIREKLRIFNYSFDDNMAYLPVTIYLIFGLIFFFLTIRMLHQTWLKKD
ncbi:hypothetical protein [uncultured Sunxiuqinia sp.]|uniref:hypothetical protein n=1 Tax=uncultured Sunxiuqinia sp. TaxID=1573825 RepID=UPI0030D7EF4B|tara:strand:- start:414 stop:695 length:282 start_codon:yes stop_codon:yes gene_type:complete